MNIQSDNLQPTETIYEDFRNSVGTMDQSGKRKWVFPRKPKGKYTNYRNYLSYLLLALFSDCRLLQSIIILSFVQCHRQKVFIFGQPFYLQDFFILALGAVTSVIFVMLFTVVLEESFAVGCVRRLFLWKAFSGK
jgi:hypothetical protein